MVKVGYVIAIIGVTSMAIADYDATVENVSSMMINEQPSPPRLLQPPLIGQFAAPDGASRGITFDGTYLWIANSGDGNSSQGRRIWKVDPNNGSVINSYPAFGSGIPVGLTWDGSYLWYAEFSPAGIFKIDTGSMSVVKQLPTPTSIPFDLACDGQYLYVVHGNDTIISKIDTASGSVQEQIPCNYSSPNVRPFGLAHLPFGSGELWTCDGNYGSNYMNEYDFASASWVDQWATNPATYPCGVAYDPATGHLWVSCWRTDSIYIFDAGTPHVAERSREFFTGFRIYPNPTFGMVTIEFNLAQTDQVNLTLYDPSGRAIKHLINRPLAIGKHTLTFDFHNLPPGPYFIFWEGERGKRIGKLIVLQ